MTVGPDDELEFGFFLVEWESEIVHTPMLLGAVCLVDQQPCGQAARTDAEATEGTYS